MQRVVLISDADFNPSTTITVVPLGKKTCIDFTDLVVDDAIALEGDQNFTIIVGESVAWVTIIDDDGKFTTIKPFWFFFLFCMSVLFTVYN